jgi:hypothetical protein
MLNQTRFLSGLLSSQQTAAKLQELQQQVSLLFYTSF